VLNELEQLRLIERRPDGRDARRMVVQLTEEGIDLEPQVFEVFQRVESAILAPLSEEEEAAVLRILRAVLDEILQDRTP
jgi:DNA-binding MarR family transcriptional regulator